jgi:Flp pilus assembly pilin Flp
MILHRETGQRMLMTSFFFNLWQDRHGQDFIEYALLAAAVAVAAGAIFPPVIMSSVSQLMSRVGSVLIPAAGS